MDKARRDEIVLWFAIGLSAVTMLFFFMAAFPPAFIVPNVELIKMILPFLFSSASGLWGYYWGSSQGSADKNTAISKEMDKLTAEQKQEVK